MKVEIKLQHLKIKSNVNNVINVNVIKSNPLRFKMNRLTLK